MEGLKLIKVLANDGIDQRAFNKLVTKGYDVLNKHFGEEEAESG